MFTVDQLVPTAWPPPPRPSPASPSRRCFAEQSTGPGSSSSHALHLRRDPPAPLLARPHGAEGGLGARHAGSAPHNHLMWAAIALYARPGATHVLSAQQPQASTADQGGRHSSAERRRGPASATTPHPQQSSDPVSAVHRAPSTSTAATSPFGPRPQRVGRGPRDTIQLREASPRASFEEADADPGHRRIKKLDTSCEQDRHRAIAWRHGPRPLQVDRQTQEAVAGCPSNFPGPRATPSSPPTTS